MYVGAVPAFLFLASKLVFLLISVTSGFFQFTVSLGSLSLCYSKFYRFVGGWYSYGS